MSDTFEPDDLALMLELGHGLKRNQFSRAQIKKLGEGSMLSQVRLLVLGQAKVEIVKHVIDLDTQPFIPNGWSVEEHKKGGQFEWNPEKVKFYLSKNQLDGKSFEGNKLSKELAKESVLNANLLDYLLKNPALIPEEWKFDEKGNTCYIFFWGTIYRDPDGHLFVRCFYWDDGRWRWGHGWLGHCWNLGSPALCSQVGA